MRSRSWEVTAVDRYAKGNASSETKPNRSPFHSIDLVIPSYDRFLLSIYLCSVFLKPLPFWAKQFFPHGALASPVARGFGEFGQSAAGAGVVCDDLPASSGTMARIGENLCEPVSFCC